MKIVHLCVCGEFFEEYAYQDNLLPKYHRKAGHDVTIIAATYSRFDQKTGKVLRDNCKEKYLADGTKVIRLKPALPLFLNSHVHCFRGLKKAIDEEKPDLIFAHSLECPNYLYLSKYKKRHPNVKVVYDNHTDFENSLHSPITRFWAYNVVGKIIAKRLLWTSDKFYGTSPIRQSFLTDVYGIPVEKTDFLPFGADDEKMHLDKREELREKVREEYGIRGDDFLIVTGGKIDQKKNIHELVKAVNEIDSPKLKILVFGSIVNEMKPIFDALKSDYFIYAGWTPSDEVYKFFYAADLVAFPGLHSVMWEQAVASRVPTAFSEMDGFKHVDIGGNCIFFKEKSASYYKTVLEKVIDDKDYYGTLKANAMSDKADLFLYSYVADKVIKDASKQQ